MSTSRRKQDRDITRVVGILFLEILAAIALLNLAGFAHQQRTSVDGPFHDVKPSPSSPFSDAKHAENLLPKVAVGRYNVRW